MSLIARLGVILGLDNKEFISGIDDATKKTREFEMNQKRALRNAQKAQDEFMTTAATGLAGVAAAALAVGKAFQYADQIEDTAAAYDVTTSSLIAMQAAMQGAGGDADNVGTALNKLASVQQDAIEGSDELRKAFTELKISGKDVENLKLEDLFKRVVQELAQVEDAGKRAALQNQILGKAMKGVDASTFVNKYKEMGDPTLLSAIQENAKAWENIEAAFKNILFFAQKLVSPLAAIVNSIANIADTMQNLKEGGSAEIDWGAGELGGMPGTAITHGYGASPQRQNKAAIQIAKDAVAGDYKNLSKKGQSDAKAAAEEEKRRQEARRALELEIKLIKDKADIADKMFNINAKGITLGEAAIAQEKMRLNLASDLAQIKNDAAKERNKEKAEIDLINAKEKAAIDARVKQFNNEDSLREKALTHQHQITMENLQDEQDTREHLKEIEYDATINLLELEKEKFSIGENAYELRKLELEKSNDLARAAFEYTHQMHEIELSYERSGKSAEEAAERDKKFQIASIAYENEKLRITAIRKLQQDNLEQEQVRRHELNMIQLKTDMSMENMIANQKIYNEIQILDLESERRKLGNDLYQLKQFDLNKSIELRNIHIAMADEARKLNEEFEKSAKTKEQEEEYEMKLFALRSKYTWQLSNAVALGDMKRKNLEDELKIQKEMFDLDIAQQKGRAIAGIQENLRIEKERLGLEAERYLLTTNQYNMGIMLLDNAKAIADAEKKYNEQMIEAEYEKQRQGKTLEAEEQYQKRVKAIEEIRDIELHAIKQVNDARQENLQNEITRQSSWVEGWGYAARQFTENAQNAFNRGAAAFSTVMSSMDSAISNFVETGKFKFEDFALGIIRDLLRIEMQAQASMLFQSMVGFFSPAASGATPANAVVAFQKRASGGYINAPTIVGENGAELFIPNMPGTVIPNGSWQQAAANMNKGGFTNNGTYIANMSAIDTQSATQFLASNKNTIWAAYQSANRSVPISR